MKIVIVGGGIGGLTAALSLHAAGFKDVVVLEAAPTIEPLGVGVNLPPHATRELIELGLGPELDKIGIETSHLTYFDPEGNELWAEKRGKLAGYKWPQYSIHRGLLQKILFDAVIERMGKETALTGHYVSDIAAQGNSALITVELEDGGANEIQADLVIGADGIKSVVRSVLFPGHGDLVWNGWVMFRGVTRRSPYLDGKTMVIVGDEVQRVVVYPIEQPKGDLPSVQNWILTRKQDGDAIDRGNWNRKADPKKLADYVRGMNFDWLDIEDLIRSADETYEYPLVDFDPLKNWTKGCVTLLGDAAHAMYPFGSNGASQAILDARFLTRELVNSSSLEAALNTYEATRKAATANVQTANRKQASEIMTRVSELARAGNGEAAKTELLAAEEHYKKLAGFDPNELNDRASWSVTLA